MNLKQKIKSKFLRDIPIPAQYSLSITVLFGIALLGGADVRSEYASPIFHSLKGLPPVLVQVGEDELLLSDSVRFAAKAKEDGVDVRLEVYPRMFHVFNAFWRIIPKAREANRKLGEFIKTQLA